MTPRLSYVIPAFDAATTLDAAVRSVLAQTDRAVEAVVIDDGSRDGTRHVAGALLGPRVRLVSQENRGLAGARNAGLHAARAPLVCFLDADDAVRPSHAQAMLGAIGPADAACGAYELVGPRLEPLGWHARVQAADCAGPRLLDVNRLAIGAVVFRREALLGVGGFDPALPVHEDWDLLLRLSRAGASWATPIDEPHFLYRLSRGSMSMHLERMWRVGRVVIQRHAPGAREASRALRLWDARALARAVAAGDAQGAASLGAGLGPIDGEAMGVLAGALRWALARQDIAPPDSWPERLDAWRARIARTLGPGPLAERLCDALTPGRWRRVLEAAAAMAGPGGRIWVYGYGRNGREAVAEAGAMGLPVAVVDDDPGALAGAALPPGALAAPPGSIGPDSVVVVTPEWSGPIVAALRARGVRRVLTPGGAGAWGAMDDAA